MRLCRPLWLAVFLNASGLPLATVAQAAETTEPLRFSGEPVGEEPQLGEAVTFHQQNFYPTDAEKSGLATGRTHAVLERIAQLFRELNPLASLDRAAARPTASHVSHSL